MKYNRRDWLFNQYITKGRTGKDIGEEVGKDPSTVLSWLKKHGIKTRSRGGKNSSGSFSKNHKLWLGKKHTQESKDKIRQARIEDGHVPYLRNGKHWLESVNTKDHPMYKGGISPERQTLYSSKKWTKCIDAVWARDCNTCQKCYQFHEDKNNRSDFHIHHIINFSHEEFRLDISNLVLLCRGCHSWVHSKENINKEFIKNA